MNKSGDIKELATALAAFQAEVGNVVKDSTNPFFKSKYASLENVINTVKPLLAKHGLAYSQFPSEVGEIAGNIIVPALSTVLMHKSGEWIESTTPLLLKDQTPQGQGSAITYMRRYALSAALGLATEEDDDGNAASAPKVEAKPVKPKVVQTAEKVEAAMKAEIKKLCDEKALVPLFSKEDYQDYVIKNTGLVLGEAKNADIIERLKAL